MENKKISKKPSLFDGVGRAVREEARRRKSEPGALLCDLVVLAVSLFFARKHIVAGVYPLASAFVAVLPSRVWVALLGAAVGALTLGKSGMIHAIILVIVVFLRVIISGNSSFENGEGLFREPLVMRIAALTVASFVGAVYEILLRGFSLSSALFGSLGVLLSVAFCFLYSGLFTLPLTVNDVLFGGRSVFSDTNGKRERYDLLLFEASALSFVFLVPFSLSGYDFFGITPSYIVCSLATLFVAKRFGAARAMAVGFVSALGISSVQSVSFALLGAAAGVLFNYGAGYAIVFGGALLVAWSAYAGGLVGFLEIFPEYTVSSLLLLPAFKRTPTERPAEKNISAKKEAEEMVGAMSLIYRSGISLLSELRETLGSLPAAYRRYGRNKEENIEDIIDKISANLKEAQIAVNAENIEKMATKVYKKQEITPDDCKIDGENSEDFFAIVKAVQREHGIPSSSLLYAESSARKYEFAARLLSGAVRASSDARLLDEVLTESAGSAFRSFGFSDGVIKVYGTRRKYIVGAAPDKDGSRISSPELHSALEVVVGGALSSPKFFRKGETALFECLLKPSYTVEYATVGSAAEGGVSGDTMLFFEREDAFYALLSDGMGSGEAARHTSRFAADYLSRILHPELPDEPAISSLNATLVDLGEECSVSIDLFRFDLLSGEGQFLKSGAAASYIKRDGSVFRIRSHTAPIGIMHAVDAERIRAEVKGGDVVVMLSDGVVGALEDAPWLIELINCEVSASLDDYVKRILSAAKKNRTSDDDMTVAAMRIVKTFA